MTFRADDAAVVVIRNEECERRYGTVEEKRQIVEETLQPSTSVAQVARAHRVNAS